METSGLDSQHLCLPMEQQKNFPFAPWSRAAQALKTYQLTRNVSRAPPHNWMACKSSLCNAGAYPWLKVWCNKYDNLKFNYHYNVTKNIENIFGPTKKTLTTSLVAFNLVELLQRDSIQVQLLQCISLSLTLITQTKISYNCCLKLWPSHLNCVQWTIKNPMGKMYPLHHHNYYI